MDKTLHTLQTKLDTLHKQYQYDSASMSTYDLIQLADTIVDTARDIRNIRKQVFLTVDELPDSLFTNSSQTDK